MKPGLMDLKIGVGLRSPFRGALVRQEGDHTADHRRANQERRSAHGDQTIALAPPGVFVRMILRGLDEAGGFRRQCPTGLGEQPECIVERLAGLEKIRRVPALLFPSGARCLDTGALFQKLLIGLEPRHRSRPARKEGFVGDRDRPPARCVRVRDKQPRRKHRRDQLLRFRRSARPPRAWRDAGSGQSSSPRSVLKFTSAERTASTA